MLGSEDAVAGPVDSCTTFNTSYSDSVPLGIHDASQSDKSGATATTMFGSVAGLTHVIKTEFDWAKATLKGKMRRQADGGSTLVQDLGQQLTAPADCAGVPRRSPRGSPSRPRPQRRSSPRGSPWRRSATLCRTRRPSRHR